MISVTLTPITTSDLHLIPVNFQDAFSKFDINAADYTFVALLRFHKQVSFYKMASSFMNISLDKSQSKVSQLISQAANRVHPAINVPEEKGLHVALAKLLKEQAERYIKQKHGESVGKSYQFFRVILIYDSIFDKPQTCLCGLIGFSQYELFKKGQPITQLLKRAITEHAGVVQDQHQLYIEFRNKDIISTHGVMFLP